MTDKEVLADMARRIAGEVLSGIGPATPMTHAAALAAIADSWNKFAMMLEL